MAALAPSAVGQTIHVDITAPPGGGGQNWGTPFNRLQPALDLAATRATSNREIFVAQGIYTPEPATGPEPRAATFSIPEGTELFGGYLVDDDRGGATRPFATTILNGLLDRSDPSNLIKCFSVVTVEATDLAVDTRIDGFTIQSGFASAIASSPTGPEMNGGAIYSVGANLVLRNCTIVDNRATESGGGLYYSGSSIDGRTLRIYRSTFKGNVANKRGGGAYVLSASAEVEDGVDPTGNPNPPIEPSWIYNSTFERNRSGAADAITSQIFSNWGGGALAVGISGNVEDFGGFDIPVPGGGTFEINLPTSLLITNSQFYQNLARGYGAAIHLPSNSRGNLLINNTFARNIAADREGRDAGGTIYAGSQGVSQSSSLRNFMFASIVYDHFDGNDAGNVEDAISGDGLDLIASGSVAFPSLVVSESDVFMSSVTTIPDGLNRGFLNYDVAPQFTNPTLFDFSLLGTSPLIDVASEIWRIRDFPDVDEDSNTSEFVPTDFLTSVGRQRVVDLIGGSTGSDLDIGAFERQQ